jgi:hypothetical protein
VRRYKDKEVVVLANFSESPQVIEERLLQGRKVLYGNNQERIDALGIVLFQ